MFEKLADRIIETEINFRLSQAEYFTKRILTGVLPVVEFYQPVIEPAEGRLVLAFVEPGAAHFVFLDEVAPDRLLDEKYRDIRRDLYGRVHDVESIELIGGKVKFLDNNSSHNPYELSLHWSKEEVFTGKVYSNTWNHMMSSSPSPLIELRGGYKNIELELRAGNRDDAERWTRGY